MKRSIIQILINNYSQFDVFAEIKETALKCAYRKEHLDSLWYDLLSRMLRYWGVDVKMDLLEATKIMLSSAGFSADFGDKADVSTPKEYGLWYNYEDDNDVIASWQFKTSQSHLKIFKMTIAVFETINYWCWYYHNVGINFTKENLVDVLQNGKIRIDWNKYE